MVCKGWGQTMSQYRKVWEPKPKLRNLCFYHWNIVVILEDSMPYWLGRWIASVHNSFSQLQLSKFLKIWSHQADSCLNCYSIFTFNWNKHVFSNHEKLNTLKFTYLCIPYLYVKILIPSTVIILTQHSSPPCPHILY